MYAAPSTTKNEIGLQKRQSDIQEPLPGSCTFEARLLDSHRMRPSTNHFGRGFPFVHLSPNFSSKLSLPIQIIPARHRNHDRSWLNASCLDMAEPTSYLALHYLDY